MMTFLQTTTRFTASALLLVLLATCVAACGYSEDEWQAQLAKYGTLANEHSSLTNKHKGLEGNLVTTQQKLDQVNAELAAERDRAAALEKDLTAAGLDISTLNASLAKRGGELSNLTKILSEREKALIEYKKRAAQLERIKARFDLLRRKLDALTNMGLKVVIRNNRMVIQLPGDVLFASGQVRLKSDGQNVLERVASIINADSGLKTRQYQVAGHTDNVELKGGMFGDNWGLSLMRARGVLLYLIDENLGALPRSKWSAAGFSDTDPIASNDTPADRSKNRRCELIVVPNAEEMLDLKAITN